MPEKFKPRQFESFESLPEEEKESFKKVDDGFVRKEALSEDEALEQAIEIKELKNEIIFKY